MHVYERDDGPQIHFDERGVVGKGGKREKHKSQTRPAAYGGCTIHTRLPDEGGVTIAALL